MNERIRELKNQCWVEKHWDKENERWIDRHIDLDKFVELIVRECGKSCTLQADEDDMFQKFGIKHFGVE